MTLTIPWGDNVTTLELDEFLPCKAAKWEVLVKIFKQSPNEVEIYNALIPYFYMRLGRYYVERDTTQAEMKQGNLKKSKSKIAKAQAKINWFTRRLKELERLLQTA